jgi:hypothetical protein
MTTVQRPPEVLFREDSGERVFAPEFDLFRSDVNLKTARNALAVRHGFIEALIADPRVAALLAAWVERLIADPGNFTTDDVIPLVNQELGLQRWRWCFSAICDVFNEMVRTKSATVRIDEEVVIHAPPLAVWFVTEFGETLDEARERWNEINAGVIAEFAEAEKAADGGQVAKSEDLLKTWGRWYYEAKVLRPPRTITSLAAENHDKRKHPGRFVVGATRGDTNGEAHDCRKGINDGIDRAEELLSLGGFDMLPPGKTRRR